MVMSFIVRRKIGKRSLNKICRLRFCVSNFIYATSRKLSLTAVQRWEWKHCCVGATHRLEKFRRSTLFHLPNRADSFLKLRYGCLNIRAAK